MAKEKLIMDYTNGDTVPCNDFDYYYCKVWVLPEEPEDKLFKVTSWEPISVPGTEGNSWYYGETTQYFTAGELTRWLQSHNKADEIFVENADRSLPIVEKICEKIF